MGKLNYHWKSKGKQSQTYWKNQVLKINEASMVFCYVCKLTLKTYSKNSHLKSINQLLKIRNRIKTRGKTSVIEVPQNCFSEQPTSIKDPLETDGLIISNCDTCNTERPQFLFRSVQNQRNAHSTVE